MKLSEGLMLDAMKLLMWGTVDLGTGVTELIVFIEIQNKTDTVISALQLEQSGYLCGYY